MIISYKYMLKQDGKYHELVSEKWVRKCALSMSAIMFIEL